MKSAVTKYAPPVGTVKVSAVVAHPLAVSMTSHLRVLKTPLSGTLVIVVTPAAKKRGSVASCR
ncbi:hypothetical protein [Streptomyces abikoensis]|uniref:hypothetical protein n=1 Tax=Streptomyces abikoensis TaxID=97398 RepID=UPI00369F1594